MDWIADNKSTRYPWEVLDKLKPYTPEDEEIYNKQVYDKWILTHSPIGAYIPPINISPLLIVDQDVENLYAELDRMVVKCIELTIKKIKNHFYVKYGSRELAFNEIEEIKGTFTTARILNGSQYFLLIPMWKKDDKRTLDDLFFDYKIHNW